VTDSGTKKLDLSTVSRRSFLLGLAGMTLTLPFNRERVEASVGFFEPFSFAFVTDVHLASGLPDTYELVHESQLFLQNVVKQLNDEKLDFIVFGGDNVQGVGKNEANWNLFLDVVQGLNAPWNFILGEDDLYAELPVDKMRTYGPDWKGKGVESDKPYWSQNPLPNVHTVGLDTSMPNSTQGDVSPRQLEWLKQDLAANKRKFIVVFSHHPALPPPPYDTGPPWDSNVLTQGAAVREILGASPFVHLAISGHVPISKVQQERDIWYVSCPSLAVFPCAFKIFRVTPEAVTMETRYVGYPALIKKARKLLASSNLAFQYNRLKPDMFALLALGTREDQNSVLNFDRGSSARAVTPKKTKKARPKKEKKAKPKQPSKSAPADTQAKPQEPTTPPPENTSKPVEPETPPTPEPDTDS
jgi:hypothetical protein